MWGGVAWGFGIRRDQGSCKGIYKGSYYGSTRVLQKSLGGFGFRLVGLRA